MHDHIPLLTCAASARPEMTAAVMAKTGLDEAILRTLVHRFNAKVRRDAVLGPIFAARIADWGPHLERMAAFWSSVALMTGRITAVPFRLMQACRSRRGISTAGSRSCGRRRRRPARPRARRTSSSVPIGSHARCIAVQDAAREAGDVPALR